MKKLKPILPSLRERKRYLAYEIIADRKVTDVEKVRTAVVDSCVSTLGELGCAKAGIMVLADTYDEVQQKGLIRVGHRHLDELRFALMNITSIDYHDAIVRSVGVSGIIKKAKEKFIGGR